MRFAVLVSLGNWQVRRLAWKEDLIARDDASGRMPSRSIFAQTGSARSATRPTFLAANEYRPVLLARRIPADERSARLHHRCADPKSGPFSGPGFWIVTPFAAEPDGTGSSSTAASCRRTAALPTRRRPPEIVEVKGLVRAPEQGEPVHARPDPEKRIFYARDPLRDRRGDRASRAGRRRFSIDLDASETPPSGLPQAGETRMTFTNNHLQYAITWYGLAAALLRFSRALRIGRLRETRQEAGLTRPIAAP